MDGWIFAVALLVGILGFELVVFRYFSNVSVDLSFGQSDPSAATTATAGGDGGGAGVDTDGPTRECHNCGADNGDVSTFHYCQHCLTRIH
jgi:hypothetical protein